MDHETGEPAELPPIARGSFVSQFAPAFGEAICARLAAGESLRAICRDPAMPTMRTLHRWARDHAGFGARLAQVQADARAGAADWAAHQREGAAWRRRRVRAAPGRSGRPSSYCPERAWAVCERLARGASLEAACRDPALPSVATVYNWLHAQAEFRRLYRLARRLQVDALVAEGDAIAARAGRIGPAAARLQLRMLAWRAAKLAPKGCWSRAEPAGFVVRFEQTLLADEAAGAQPG